MSRFGKLLLIFVFILAFFLRFNKLSSIPPGLGRDEVSVAYNAYSILQTGRDEHGRFLPVYFEAIGDQKLPGVIYSTVLSVWLFGLTPLGARFPEALLGSLTVVLIYFLVKKMGELEPKLRHKNLSLVATVLLAVNPWHIYHSRGAFEICITLFYLTLGTYAFLKGLKLRLWFFIAVTSFIIAFYSYSMTRLLSPLLFLSYCFIFRKEILNFSKRYLLSVGIWAIILLLPFVLTFLNPGGIYGPKGAVIFTSSITKSTFLEFRSYILNSPVAFLGPLIFNRIIMMLYEYAENIISAISPGFYFVFGSPVAGIGTIGQFYLLELVPFFVGIIIVGKFAVSGSRVFRLLLTWIILTVLSASMTVYPPYATRTFFIVVPIIVVITLGWIKVFDFIKKSRLSFVIPAFIFVFFIYAWHFVYYLTSYYYRFPIVYAQNWEAKAKELFDYLATNEDKVGKIIITKPEKSMYAFYLFYRRIPPESVWTNLERYPADPDGWHHGKKFGKYEFRQIDWKKDHDQASVDAILVAEGGEYPERTVVAKEILYDTKYAIFPVGQQIMSLPERPVAYRIWQVTSAKNP